MELMRLSELREGEKGIVVEVKGDLKTKLLTMGIVKGTEVKVVRNAPLKDPLEIEVRGYLLSLRRDEAEHVFVERR